MRLRYCKYLLILTTLFIAYLLTAKLGLDFAAVSNFTTLIWPPSGIALAAILLYGYRVWPAITIAAFLVNLSIGASPFVAVCIATGNTLEPLLGAYLIKQFVGPTITFMRAKDVLGLIFYAAFFSTLVSSSIGVECLFLSGGVSSAAYHSVQLTWWGGDFMGVLIITPLIVVWAKQSRGYLTNRRLTELFLVGLFLVGLNIVIFNGFLTNFFGGPASDTYKYLLFPTLIWVAFRYGMLGTVSANFIVAAVSICCTIAIYSSQSTAKLTEALLAVERFIGINSIAYMGISAIMAERDQSILKEKKLLRQKIRLNKQAKYLKELNKSKDEFIQLASHQLRTPASAVKMYLGMILENRVGNDPKKQMDFTRNANAANERQIQIIDELLSVAQIDMGNIAIYKEKTDMKILIDNVIDGFSSVIAERDQTLDFVHGNNDYTAQVDRGKMTIAVENLIDNASKYSAAGKKIKVGLASGKNGLKITVKDEGVGIAKKDIGKLFTKFSRIHNELSISRGGSGLGLYWVNKIIKIHGGKITVSSRVGHGSTFQISL